MVQKKRQCHSKLVENKELPFKAASGVKGGHGCSKGLTPKPMSNQNVLDSAGVIRPDPTRVSNIW